MMVMFMTKTKKRQGKEYSVSINVYRKKKSNKKEYQGRKKSSSQIIVW